MGTAAHTLGRPCTAIFVTVLGCIGGHGCIRWEGRALQFFCTVLGVHRWARLHICWKCRAPRVRRNRAKDLSLEAIGAWSRTVCSRLRRLHHRLAECLAGLCLFDFNESKVCWFRPPAWVGPVLTWRLRGGSGGHFTPARAPRSMPAARPLAGITRSVDNRP